MDEAGLGLSEKGKSLKMVNQGGGEWALPTEETPRAGLDSPAFSRVQGVACQCLGPELGQEILFSGRGTFFSEGAMVIFF